MRFCHGGFAKLPVTVNKAKRIKELPPYLFAEIDRRKRAALARGVDLIDLGIGDPDIPTPSAVVEKLMEGASKPVNHRYPNSSGMAEFRDAVAKWYKNRFNVKLDPEKEVVSLIGSKEGIGNMAVAFVDPGDVVLVSSPCYPVYHIGTAFSGGKNYFLAAQKRKPFFARSGRDSNRRCGPGQAALDQLSQQSHCGSRGRELLSSAWSNSPINITLSSAMTPPTRKWATTAIVP